MSTHIEEFTKKTTCPHCKQAFEVYVSLETAVGTSVLLGSDGVIPEELLARRAAKDGRPRITPPTKNGNFLDGLDDAQRLTIEMAERAGMLETYGNVFKHAHGTVPANLPKSFLGWTRQLKPKLIAAEVRNYLKDEFGGFIDFKSAQSIGAIISDGAIVHLVPCQLIGDAPVGGAVIRQTGEQLVTNVQQWVRTKYGYVAGKGVFADSLRKKSFGDFANPIL